MNVSESFRGLLTVYGTVDLDQPWPHRDWLYDIACASEDRVSVSKREPKGGRGTNQKKIEVACGKDSAKISWFVSMKSGIPDPATPSQSLRLYS